MVAWLLLHLPAPATATPALPTVSALCALAARLSAPHCRCCLPQDYGFLVPGNPHETVQLRFDRGLIEVRTNKHRWSTCTLCGVCSAVGLRAPVERWLQALSSIEEEPG